MTATPATIRARRWPDRPDIRVPQQPAQSVRARVMLTRVPWLDNRAPRHRALDHPGTPARVTFGSRLRPEYRVADSDLRSCPGGGGVPGGLMLRRGGQRRGLAVAAIVLVLGLAAPELAAPAGAVVARAANHSELQSRPAVRTARRPKKRRRPVRRARRLNPMSAAKKKALLQRYIKTHPGVLAAHAAGNATLAKKLKAAASSRAHPRKKVKKIKKNVKKVRRPRPRQAATQGSRASEETARQSEEEKDGRVDLGLAARCVDVCAARDRRDRTLPDRLERGRRAAEPGAGPSPTPAGAQTRS